MDGRNLPNSGAYTRLRPSNVHGVGVFAIRDIPKETNIFGNDISQMVWIPKKEIGNLTPEIQQLYDDFCIINKDAYGCPENFNSLTLGWYINEPPVGEFPNVKCNEDYDFIAIREIKKGEELFVNYADYNDIP